MRNTRNEVIALVTLVSLGVVLRLGLRDLPNFAPVAALALFAGYYFRSRLMAIAAPLSVMLISDFFVGGYSLAMMIVVYTMLALPVAARGWLRRNCQLGHGSLGANARSVAVLTASALGSSLAFFLVTNVAVWLVWYERSLGGLAECYLLALPFFRFTLAGDLVFAVALFSSYAVLLSLTGTRSIDGNPTTGIRAGAEPC
jgi:hypothetical protein